MLPNFDLVRPTTTDEAARLVSYESKPYVGGTELLLAMKMGLLQPDKLVDLKRIPDLQTIAVDDGELVIGAAVTHRQIAQHPLVEQHVPLLAEVERHVGNARVRASGSIGGNLCFAEPKSDIATTLIALDAAVSLQSPRGTRRLSVDEFTLAPYTTAAEDDELLTTVHIPLSAARRGIYLKYQTMERPTVGVALVFDGDRRRLVIGAVGGRPARFDFDAGQHIDPEQAAKEVEVIPDLTGSEEYKRHIVAVYVRQALGAAIVSDEQTIHTTINGVAITRNIPVRLTLAEFLREALGMTGTKVSCGMQVCGVCTVLVNGLPVSSCTYLAVDVDGAEVLTVEGLAQGGKLHPVQQAFMDKFAMQCGFCTPGFIMMAVALLNENPAPTVEDVKHHLEGNICRCTGYRPIIEAVMAAAQTIREAERV